MSSRIFTLGKKKTQKTKTKNIVSMPCIVALGYFPWATPRMNSEKQSDQYSGTLPFCEPDTISFKEASDGSRWTAALTMARCFVAYILRVITVTHVILNGTVLINS